MKELQVDRDGCSVNLVLEGVPGQALRPEEKVAVNGPISQLSPRVF